MPGVSDATFAESGSSVREKAESIKLWLPSHLDAIERDSLCSAGAITSERELRFGQLHDALDELRRARRIRRGLITFHRVQLAGQGQKTQTKSRAVMHTIQERIDRFVRRYRVARNALLQLEPSAGWQDLYPALEDCDNRGPGKEPEEVSTSDGRYTPSWIWLSNSNTAAGDPTQSTISPDEVNEDMRVEWAQCIARADRWEEEVLLLQEEMRRVVRFLEWKSNDWISRADTRAGVVAPEVCLGLSAYAHKQSSIFRNLAIRFCQRWRSRLVSLSLSHTWATEFLGTQGVPLIDPDSKKHEVEDQEHSLSESHVTPRDQPLITRATATPPTPSNPKTSNGGDGDGNNNGDNGDNNSDNSDNNNGDDDNGGDDNGGNNNNSDSDDFDVSSSEFDEDEDERWYE